MKKFRVWDGERFDTLEQHNSWSSFWDRNDPTYEPDFVFQQFTRLKDKNNKEIYEGDILKAQSHTYSEGSLMPTGMEDIFMLCEYHPARAAFHLKDISRDGWAGWDFHDGMTDKIEIIGNIFENSNFLK